jgi:GNAT superfamily N-acetyltransferase
VALWAKPDAPGPNLIDLFQTQLIQAPLQLGWTSFWRLWQTINKWEKTRHRQMETYWYLMMIGVDPAYQRQGIGIALLQPILRQADQKQIPCYLETTSAHNVPFYQKCGFDTFSEGQIKSDLFYWMMRREPVAGVS